MAKLAYILSNFPHLTETFIAREILELIELEADIDVLSLRSQKHADAQAISSGAVSVYYSSTNPWKILQAILQNHLRQQGLFLQRETWQDALLILRNGRFKSLLKFLVIVALAETTINKYSDQIVREKITHLHSHFLFAASYITYRLSKRWQTTYSLTLHTRSHSLGDNSLIRKIIGSAKFVNCISSNLESYVKQFQVDVGDKMRLIRNGIEIGNFDYTPKYEVGNPYSLIAIGSLLDKKGFDDVIRACAILKSQQVNFRAIIIGEGKERENLEHLIQEENLITEVQLVGSLPFQEVKKHLKNADVLLMPSKQPANSSPDGLPTVIIEAMATGVPVISTDFAGIPDIVRHQITGLAVAPGNYRELAVASLTLLEDTALRNKIIDNARTLVEKEYNLKTNAQRLLQAFAE